MIRKILFVTLWLAIGAGMVTLLAAAMRKQKSEQCSDYIISIKEAKNNLFVDEKDITKLLTAAAQGGIKGQAMASIDLQKMEQLLEDNVWIKDAELYFDNNDVLHVTVLEREPVARLFTTAGRSFYIDADEKTMPLSDKMSAKVPVFTGFPEKKVFTAKDSVLLQGIKNTALFINNDPFWMAQVAQINIDENRNFEMIPLVGNHIVKLGDGDEIENKFRRLYVFYKDVLSRTGFEKYKTIDVQYAGQVVGVKGYTTKVDSIQLRKNVEKLLQQARNMQNDTLIPVAPVIEKPSAEASTEITPAANEDDRPGSNTPDLNSVKLSESKPVKPAKQNPKPVKRQPEAVMPPRKN